MDDTDRDAQLTVLTTEHFALQGGRGSTVSESSARAALFVGAVSSGLVALGFVGRGGEDQDTFNGFALVVLPTLYLLGVFTFVRLVQNSIEDMFLGRAINRIRQYYNEVLGDDARYLMLNADDDPVGVLRNSGIGQPSRWQLFFTLAMMIAVLASVIGGTTVAVILSQWDVAVGVTAIAGAMAGVLSLAALQRWQRGAHDSARERVAPLSPSPDAS